MRQLVMPAARSRSSRTVSSIPSSASNPRSAKPRDYSHNARNRPPPSRRAFSGNTLASLTSIVTVTIATFPPAPRRAPSMVLNQRGVRCFPFLPQSRFTHLLPHNRSRRRSWSGRRGCWGCASHRHELSRWKVRIAQPLREQRIVGACTWHLTPIRRGRPIGGPEIVD